MSDESTRTLMERFYGAVGKGAAVEDALRQAQLALLKAEGTKHPFYWAAFVPMRGPR